MCLIYLLCDSVISIKDILSVEFVNHINEHIQKFSRIDAEIRGE